jgi:hypothetical protein
VDRSYILEAMSEAKPQSWWQTVPGMLTWNDLFRVVVDDVPRAADVPLNPVAN